MHIFYRLSVFIAYCGIFVYCQRGSASGIKGTSYIGGAGSSGSFSGSNGNSNSCIGNGCNRVHIIVLSTFGGIGGITTLITIACYFCKRYKYRSLQANSISVEATKHKSSEYTSCDITVFKSGFWSSRYFQFGKWHGPYSFPLSFDCQSFKITGLGSDNIGKFTIDGRFSNETGRMYLIKKYQLGTGDPSGNLGHQVTIHLAWNSKTCQFEGKWNVRTKSYCGRDKFELKFDEERQLWSVFGKY